MGLSGIFDPMVRAYFANNCGGGEAAIKIMVAESMDDVDCVIPAGLLSEFAFYKIGDYVPTVEEMQSAIYTVNADVGSGALRISSGDFVFDDMTADSGFTYYLVTNRFEEVYFMVCGADVEDENMGVSIKAGTYFNSALISFPLVSMLVIGA